MWLQDIVGNAHSLMFQGWTFPVPDDDIMSCEGLESPNKGHAFEEITTFEDALQPMVGSQSPQWVCRAASGSQMHLGISASMCAGDIAHDMADTDTSGELFTTYDGEQSFHGGREHNLSNFEAHSLQIVDTSEHDSATQKATGMQNYATSTDCILQNLTMVVGNPSVRCFANAPWRAFTRVCALLQETSAQPWGTLQEAVQESIDTAEPVDIQALPGLRVLEAFSFQ